MAVTSNESVPCILIFMRVLVIHSNLKSRRFFFVLDLVPGNHVTRESLKSFLNLLKWNSGLTESQFRHYNQLLLNTMGFIIWLLILDNLLQLVVEIHGMPRRKLWMLKVANGIQVQIIHFIHRKIILMNFWFWFNVFRIYKYATASTDSAAYIIGGETYSSIFSNEYVSTIGEYKNNKWTKFGDLSKARYYSSAIVHNGEYIIVGCYVNSGR